VSQLLLVGNTSDRVEVGLGRRDPGFVDRVGVEIGVVIIGDQRVIAAGRLRFQDIVEQLARVLFTHLVGDPEPPDPRAVRRDFGLPIAVGIFVEIVTGHGRLVHPGQVDADTGPWRLLGRIAAGLGVARAERERGNE
jgi:hypothetical protein